LRATGKSKVGHDSRAEREYPETSTRTRHNHSLVGIQYVSSVLLLRAVLELTTLLCRLYSETLWSPPQVTLRLGRLDELEASLGLYCALAKP
jgi:hypothetical protein